MSSGLSGENGTFTVPFFLPEAPLPEQPQTSHQPKKVCILYAYPLIQNVDASIIS
jgi:hypothetical protein